MALAKKVKEFAGGTAGLDQVENLLFTFNGTRRVFWDCCAGKVRVETVQDAELKPGQLGTRWDALVYDVTNDVSLLQSPPPPSQHAPKLSGKSMWINDTYWLLAPLKVLDDGVRLAIDPPAPGDPARVQRLRLSFQTVGITPQNQYVLHVESQTGRMLRWDYYKDAHSAPRSWQFLSWQQVGPLKLSLSRPPVDPDQKGASAIEITDVKINVTAPEDVWTRTSKLLHDLK